MEKIPSADTIFNYIKSNSIDYILSSFRKINNKIFRIRSIENNIHDITVDFPEILQQTKK